MKMLQITIDSNCAINLFDPNSESATSVEHLNALVARSKEGKAAIAVTTRLEADLRRDPNSARRAQLLAEIDQFPVVSTVGRWGVSKWGADLWAGEETVQLTEQIKEILSPGLTADDPRFSNKINDIDHLVGHFMAKRDIFVTDDRGILRRRGELRAGLGIVVMTPREALEQIDAIPPS